MTGFARRRPVQSMRFSSRKGIVMSSRFALVVRNSLLVVGIVASIIGFAYGAKVWSSQKSPEELRQEIKYRTSMNELRELAARGDGRSVASREIDQMDDLKPAAWSGPAIVAASFGALVLTLVIACVLSASAHVLRSGGG